jgi:hypothetical protein
MEETIEACVKTVIGMLSRCDNNEKSAILTEVGSRLMDKSSDYLKEEYLGGAYDA